MTTQLISQDTTFKLLIPSSVEEKIRHLCSRISTIEWSGVLFYTCKGSFEDNSLEVTCVDIFPMDIGNATYTEFTMSPDVASYMAEHPELLDCYTGLVHSHQEMATFFSSTDLSTLKEEGAEKDHFVSLIVNNAGKYTAAITRKISCNTKKYITYSYTFNDKVSSFTEEKEENNVVVLYNYLDIDKQEVILPLSELDNRINAIKSNKKSIKSTYKESKVLPKAKSAFKESLFDFDYMDSWPNYKIAADPNEQEIKIDPSIIKSYVLQLITGSIAISDTSTIVPSNWAIRMTSVFDKRFEDFAVYKLWVETLVEFILFNFVPDKYANDDEYTFTLAHELYSAIEKLPSNKYIEEILKVLLIWMK